MALTLEQIINNGLLDELAGCFDNGTDAMLLLHAINFPKAARPSFARAHSPMDFWLDICEQVENGRVSGGFEPLLRACARRLPGNSAFAPFAQAPPQAQAGQTVAAADYQHVTSDFYHCFISYNSRYREEVKAVNEALRNRGVRPWMDVQDLGYGTVFAREIEQVLSRVRVFLACIGAENLGPWQTAEVEVALANSVHGRCTVIPVLLSDVTNHDALPPFLRRFNSVGLKGDARDAAAFDELSRTILLLNQV